MNVAVNSIFPTSIALKSKYGRWVQTTEYENANVFCQNCSHFGHLIDACKNNPSQNTKATLDK